MGSCLIRPPPECPCSAPRDPWLRAPLPTSGMDAVSDCGADGSKPGLTVGEMEEDGVGDPLGPGSRGANPLELAKADT